MCRIGGSQTLFSSPLLTPRGREQEGLLEGVLTTLKYHPSPTRFSNLSSSGDRKEKEQQ